MLGCDGLATMSSQIMTNGWLLGKNDHYGVVLSGCQIHASVLVSVVGKIQHYNDSLPDFFPMTCSVSCNKTRVVRPVYLSLNGSVVAYL